jgi:hypothetical protein
LAVATNDDNNNNTNNNQSSENSATRRRQRRKQNNSDDDVDDDARLVLLSALVSCQVAFEGSELLALLRFALRTPSSSLLKLALRDRNVYCF